MHLTPITDDPAVAQEWFDLFEGAGLDGSCASRRTSPYSPGKRTMLKVKYVRTADVVVAGWRPYKECGPRRIADARSPAARSVRRGGNLCIVVGAAGAFSRENRIALAKELAASRSAPDDDHPWKWGFRGPKVPGMQSRWTGKKDLGFHPLRPILVAEVKYDHMQGDRFRHVASFVRWRPDREPSSCTYEQLERPAFRRRFGAARRGGLMADETHIEVGGRAGACPIPTRSTSRARLHEARCGFPTTRQSPEFMLPYILNRPTALGAMARRGAPPG